MMGGAFLSPLLASQLHTNVGRFDCLDFTIRQHSKEDQAMAGYDLQAIWPLASGQPERLQFYSKLLKGCASNLRCMASSADYAPVSCQHALQCCCLSADINSSAEFQAVMVGHSALCSLQAPAQYSHISGAQPWTDCTHDIAKRDSTSRQHAPF